MLSSYMQARDGAIAPIEAAAAFAQAARPARRVAFNAACRVVAPDPPKAAKPDTPALWSPHKPTWQTRRSTQHLPVEVSFQHARHRHTQFWVRYMPTPLSAWASVLHRASEAMLDTRDAQDAHMCSGEAVADACKARLDPGAAAGAA